VVGKFLLGITLLIASIAASVPAGAQGPAHAATTDLVEPKLLITSEDWRAFASGSGANQVCYVAPVAKPRPALAKQNRAPTIYVTHRPARQAFDVVAYAAGYEFRRDSMARVAFTSGPSHRLFTDGGFAWAGDENNDRRLVRAMAESTTMTVTGLGTDGHLHEDTVSLAGFSAAFQRASSECRRPGPPIKR
jgi:hypothetical protein